MCSGPVHMFNWHWLLDLKKSPLGDNGDADLVGLSSKPKLPFLLAKENYYWQYSSSASLQYHIQDLGQCYTSVSL